jgi:PAS domain S-box-containing protein
MNKTISRMSSLTVIAIACLVLVGWQFDITILKSGWSGSISTMKVNTAICFILSGISLLCLQSGRKPQSLWNRSSQIMAAISGAIALLTITEYLFGWNLQVDQWLYLDNVTLATPYPGRMGINTAINFLLMGTALIFLGKNRHRETWFAHIFSSCAVIISLLAFLGYVFTEDGNNRLISITTTQAINSIALFFILYAGILALRPKKGLMQIITSPRVGGNMARRLLFPWATLFPMMLNWLTLQAENLGWFNDRFGYTFRSTVMFTTFSILILGTAQFLNRLDTKRHQAKRTLKRINENLELIVAEKTNALRNSEEQFRHAFEDASIGMAIVSLAGNWIKVNSALCNIVGYSAAELIDLTFQDITHPDDLNIDLAYVLQLLAGEISTYQMEKRYFTKQGHIIWILLNASLIKDSQGHPIHFISQIQDITTRKEAQKALELKSIMNNMAGGVSLIKSSDHTIIYVNPRFEAMFGYTDRELKGQSINLLNYVDLEVKPKATFLEIFTQTDRIGEAHYEVYNRRKDGTLFWSRVYPSTFEHSEYGLVYIIVQEDITQLKLAEQQLQTTTNRLNFLLSYSPVVISSGNVNRDRGMTFISENSQDVLGYTAKIISESSEFWINHIHPDDLGQVVRKIVNVCNDGFYTHEFRFLHSDGSYRWMQEQVKLICDREDNPLEILAYLIDINDRKQIEIELQEARKAAEAASQAKSMFLSNMSHELRTPLNAILGFTQLMSHDRTLTNEYQQYLAIINRSGERLLGLINDILDLSKIESGQMLISQSDFDLKNLLNSIKDIFQVQAKSKAIELTIDCDPNLPQLIHTDEKRLYQVLVNLLGNAIKFTNQGTVQLRVKIQKTIAADRVQLLFEVEDTGFGIAAAEIGTLFKLFSQTESGNKFNQGTGLGLAISQKFIHLLGSQIQVQSILGHGSIFYFELDVNIPQSLSIAPSSPQQRAIGLASGQPNYRILIVEDLEENRQLLVEILSSIGFEVREATQGLEAIALWESWSPHLIWMDLRMPIMDGYTAIKRIREHPQGHEPIIITLTASVFEEEREKVLASGCNDFISKPFQRKTILDKITQYLGVQYTYEVELGTPEPPSVEILSPKDLTTMPTQWLTQMYQAAHYLDTEVMNDLISQIPEANAGLSNTLIDLVNNFNSDQIMELIKPILPSPTPFPAKN